jgi:hypothetical protein
MTFSIIVTKQPILSLQHMKFHRRWLECARHTNQHIQMMRIAWIIQWHTANANPNNIEQVMSHWVIFKSGHYAYSACKQIFNGMFVCSHKYSNLQSAHVLSHKESGGQFESWFMWIPSLVVKLWHFLLLWQNNLFCHCNTWNFTGDDWNVLDTQINISKWCASHG